MTDDDLLFADEDAESPLGPLALAPWRILIVDDEPDIHSVTRLALRKLSFKGREVEFLSAYSAAEARELLGRQQDIAIILLDVVMESDDAGLLLARWIRETLGNRQVRIILRTGQPGQAPERQVILDYDINDYKSKSELTADRLFTTVIAALRGYDDLVTIETSRRGLEKIIAASDHLIEREPLAQFASGVLTQIGALLEMQVEGIILLQHQSASFEVLTCSGRFAPSADQPLCALEETPVDQDILLRALSEKAAIIAERALALYLGGIEGQELVAWVEPNHLLNADEIQLLRVFSLKLAASFSNVLLYEQLRQANADLERRVAERTRELAEANAKLSLLANTDSLTGLANRRAIFEQADKELARYHRQGHPCSVILLDIDHFKRINDRWGHGVGDQILVHVAGYLQSAIRREDYLGRIGGEEFMLLIPGMVLDVASVRAGELCAGIAARPLICEHGEIPVTASLGLTAFIPADLEFKEVFKRADEALYRAKGAGRNRVELG